MASTIGADPDNATDAYNVVTDQATNLTAVATLLARSLYKLATGNNASDTLLADEMTVGFIFQKSGFIVVLCAHILNKAFLCPRMESPDGMIGGILFLSCLFVCLSVCLLFCLSVVNFNIRYNF